MNKMITKQKQKQNEQNEKIWKIKQKVMKKKMKLKKIKSYISPQPPVFLFYFQKSPNPKPPEFQNGFDIMAECLW